MKVDESYLAFDPGGTTGWALCRRGRPTDMGEVPFDDVFSFLLEERWAPVRLYVVEDYIIRPQSVQGGYTHQWNKGEALRVIGAIELVCNAKKAALVKQQPSIKDLASKRLTGKPYKETRVTHMGDAALHGFYWYWKEHPEYAENEFAGGSTDSHEERVPSAPRVVEIRGYSGLRKAGSKKRVPMP